MNTLKGTVCLLTVITMAKTVQMPVSEEMSFEQCLKTRQAGSIMACAGLAALSRMQSLQDVTSVTLAEGITLERDAHAPRGIDNFLDRDPSDFRGIMESMGIIMGHRTLHWDMSNLYPGLAMRVGPSLGANGMLEFVLDPLRESQNPLKEGSTGRILTRQLLIPFLLGFKFNIATLVPILFGLLVLLAKKAFFVSKIALVVTSALGLGSLLLGGAPHLPGGGHGGIYGGGGHGGGGYGLGLGGYHRHHNNPLYYKHGEDEAADVGNSGVDSGVVGGGYLGHGVDAQYAETAYRGHVNTADELNLGGRFEAIKFEREKKSAGRNFAWVEAENVAT